MISQFIFLKFKSVKEWFWIYFTHQAHNFYYLEIYD